MKVYYVTNSLDGCAYVRAIQPMIYNGWSGDRMSLMSVHRTDEEAAREMTKSDVIVFHRPDEDGKLQMAMMLKKLGKKIVFDNDDTFKVDKDMIMSEFILSKQKNIDEFIKFADLVTTTTDFLADEYRELNKNVYVLPNCVDPMDWPKPLRNDTDKVRIGIFGSATLNDDSEDIKDILKELGNREDVQLVMFGLPRKEHRTNLITKVYKKDIDYWNDISVEWHPLVQMSEYFRTLNSLRLDIALIPRKDNYFNRCKSNLKFMECSMLEIPVIAQTFKDGNGPYDKDSEHCLLAQTQDEWTEAIEKLISDKKLRQEIGKKAKEYTLNKYSIESNAKKWNEIYKTL